MTVDPNAEQQRVIDFAVAAHIATGFAQAERGEWIDADAVIETLRQRRAERIRPQE